MGIIEIILLAIGLAMDCLAVSLTQGMTRGDYKGWGRPLLMAVLFGLFQGIMPLIGYACGMSFTRFISTYDHWVALLLLGFIGGKMLYGGIKEIIDERKDKRNGVQHTPKPADFSIKTLFVLAVATSIDALATGIIFVSYETKTLWLGISIIAFVSFLFGGIGYLTGAGLTKKIHVHLEPIGGIILIGIGIKILVEHLIQCH